MNQATEKDNRDQQIGRSIAAAVQQQGMPRACLSDEQLATLLDNRMPAGERERCLAHIAACDSCLARYSTAASLMQDSPVATKVAGRGLLYASLAIAAVALLAIGLVLQQQPGKNNGQVQIAGQGAVGSIGTAAVEKAQLHKRLKNWAAETIQALEAKQYDKIDRNLPATFRQEARSLGDTVLADKLEPLVNHLAEPKDTDEWYGELGAKVVAVVK